MNMTSAPRHGRRHAHGFTLVELMVAMTIGIAIIGIMLAVYLNSRTSGVRQSQLSDLQQSVRTAFDYLVSDVRGVGHQGCFTGRTGATVSVAGLAATLPTNYAVGVEGFDYNTTGTDLTLSTYDPADTTDNSAWSTNTSGVTQIPTTTIGGATGISPDSDVLVLRGVVGRPLRLTAATAAAAVSLPLESVTTGVTCTTGNALSGLCASSHALIASCTQAQFFQVESTSTTALAVPAAHPIASAYSEMSEVFPVQTVVYYVKKSVSGKGTSLYRRVFDGNQGGANGLEQELIEGIENLQVRYGVDDDPAGTIRGNVGSYKRANEIPDWSRVVAVRMSILLRSSTAVEGIDLPATAPMNGMTVTFPTDGPKYDRRVFTTTVALRNRVAYN